MGEEQLLQVSLSKQMEKVVLGWGLCLCPGSAPWNGIRGEEELCWVGVCACVLGRHHGMESGEKKSCVGVGSVLVSWGGTMEWNHAFLLHRAWADWGRNWQLTKCSRKCLSRLTYFTFLFSVPFTHPSCIWVWHISYQSSWVCIFYRRLTP